MACTLSGHRVHLAGATDLLGKVESVVLQWYRKFPIVLVECQGSPVSVPATVVPGHILGSWDQLCCPSNVCMHEDGCSDRISAELVVWHLSRMLLLLLSYVEALKVCCQRQVDAVTC